ncbi:hypothetical protein RI367_005163 [Sorochytrium milnesiophthora]
MAIDTRTKQPDIPSGSSSAPGRELAQAPSGRAHLSRDCKANYVCVPANGGNRRKPPEHKTKKAAATGAIAPSEIVAEADAMDVVTDQDEEHEQNTPTRPCPPAPRLLLMLQLSLGPTSCRKTLATKLICAASLAANVQTVTSLSPPGRTDN